MVGNNRWKDRFDNVDDFALVRLIPYQPLPKTSFKADAKRSCYSSEYQFSIVRRLFCRSKNQIAIGAPIKPLTAFKCRK